MGTLSKTRVVSAVFRHQDNLCKRCLATLVKKQDPEYVKNMPIFEYATEKTKRSKRVYLWGSAMHGALGVPTFLRPPPHKTILRSMHKPFRFPFTDTHKVNDIACGYGFTVIAATNNDNDYTLFGTGLNNDFQIGFHQPRKGHPLETLISPVPIFLPLLHRNTKAVQVACGRSHTVVQTDREGIFSLGNNAYGQCGALQVSKERMGAGTTVNKVEGFDEEIVKILCGQDHTLFLDKAGSVYSCGWSADGQTGLGHYKNQFTPCKVKGDIEGERIIHLASSADCVLALSDKGDVFGWGNSEYRQLNSATDSQQINIPMHLKFNNIDGVKSVACGGTMCAILSESGCVYVWGYGILGQGPEVSRLDEPTLLPPPLFGANQFNPDSVVDKIICSLSHFAAVTNKGHLYMWGRNREKCLGLGQLGDQYFPFKVSVPAEVQSVSCGVDHTAVICKSFA